MTRVRLAFYLGVKLTYEKNHQIINFVFIFSWNIWICSFARRRHRDCVIAVESEETA